MTTRILKYLRTQHLGLIALILVVAGSTAYAAGLAKNSVKSKQIKNGQVKSVDVKDQGIAGIDIADGSVGAAEVADGSIGSPKIADGAVSTPKIADDAVIGQKIATGVIGGGKLSPGAVDTSKVADGSLTQADFDPNSVASVITKSSGTASDGTLHPVLTLPGFGTLQLACTELPNVGVNYAFESGVAQVATLVVRNASGVASISRVDTSPATAAIGSGLGDGYLWIDTGTRVARIVFTVQGSDGCPYSLQATVDSDEA